LFKIVNGSMEVMHRQGNTSVHGAGALRRPLTSEEEDGFPLIPISLATAAFVVCLLALSFTYIWCRIVRVGNATIVNTKPPSDPMVLEAGLCGSTHSGTPAHEEPKPLAEDTPKLLGRESSYCQPDLKQGACGMFACKQKVVEEAEAEWNLSASMPPQEATPNASDTMIPGKPKLLLKQAADWGSECSLDSQEVPPERGELLNEGTVVDIDTPCCMEQPPTICCIDEPICMEAVGAGGTWGSEYESPLAGIDLSFEIAPVEIPCLADESSETQAALSPVQQENECSFPLPPPSFELYDEAEI